MQIKAILILAVLMLSACGDQGGSGGGTTQNRKLQNIKENIKTSYDELVASCNCTGDARYLLLGAITQAEFQKANIDQSDVFSSKSTTQSFYDELIGEIIR